MKKFTLIALLLAPAIALGASDYTKTVRQGGTVKVCSYTTAEVALVAEDGATVAAVSGSKLPGKCVKLKVPKTAAPGKYTLQTYSPTYKGCGAFSANCQTKKNDLHEIGTVTVTEKKAKKAKK